MQTPETSRLFTRWTNPASGVETFILTERPASVQRHFYYTNRGFTDDGRFCWLSCEFVPPGGRLAVPVLGVIDFERDDLRVYHDTQHTSSPFIDPATGDAYFTSGMELWKRGPQAGDRPIRINRLPDDVMVGRKLDRLATHLTLSADGKSVNFDTRSNGRSLIGDIPLDGLPPRIWTELTGFYNHAQFSPTDSDLLLLAHDVWQDDPTVPFDGQHRYHRMWTLRRGEEAKPVLSQPVTHSGHEWWDADGEHVWYVHYGVGVKKVNVASQVEQNLWPGRLSHAFTDRTSRYLVADMMADPRVSDCHVEFRDTKTSAKAELVNRPPLAAHLTQCGHLHPHPQFCCNDRYICYTTTVHDRVDLAFANVHDLAARTSISKSTKKDPLSPSVSIQGKRQCSHYSYVMNVRGHA